MVRPGYSGHDALPKVVQAFIKARGSNDRSFCDSMA